jgi:hypothetical protein
MRTLSVKEKYAKDRMSDSVAKPQDTTHSVSYMVNRVLLKAKYSFYSALVFFLFANPETAMILQRVLGKVVSFTTPGGAPTVSGIFILTGCFFFTMLGLMLIPTE